VSYADPTTGNDANATQDSAGNDAATLQSSLIYGTAGNDTVLFNAASISQLASIANSPSIADIDGRGGIDTIRFDGSGLTLDLTLINDAVISSVERIDLTGSGNNTLKLNLDDVLASGSENVFNSTNTTSGLETLPANNTKQVRIEGDTGDKVILADFLSGWTVSATPVEADSQIYVAYNHNSSAAQLLIDQQILVQ
jgi:hypothetical protein